MGMIDRGKINVYDKIFYAQHQAGMLGSARAILPIVLAYFRVRSAVDIGCGCGAWLHVLEDYGVTDVRGYDGEYVERSLLLIDQTKFVPMDLRENFNIGRRFELALSLEVAEHLPKEFAEPFVERLVKAAPNVLFSAAIPGQGGTHHVNEQWQDYWRSIFKSFCYFPVDIVRPFIWGRADVEFWYQQNIVLYCSSEILEDNKVLVPVPDDISLNIVHPKLYEIKCEVRMGQALRLLPALAWRSVRRRVGKCRP
jgi:hypothetical protein